MVRQRRPLRTSLFVEVLEDRLCLSPPGGGSLSNPALAFIAAGRHSADLFVTTADGSVTKQLTNDTVQDSAPSWSPDGTRIAFLRRTDPTKACAALHTIRPDGTGLTLIHDFCNPPGQPFPHENYGGTIDLAWSPDGTKLVFPSVTSNSPADLYVIDVASGAVQALLSDNLNDVNDPSWSPDLDGATPGYQGMIVMTALVTTVIDGQQIPNLDLFVLNVAIDAGGTIQTGPLTNLTNSPGNGIHNELYPEWSPSGTSIAYSERNNGQPYVLKVMTLEVTGTGLAMTAQITGTRVLVSDVHGNAEPTWSPDSRFIAFFNSRLINPGSADYDLFRIRADGTGLTNITRTDRRREWAPDWNPAWTNNLGASLQAVSLPAHAAKETLTISQVELLLPEALARWQATGTDVSALSSIDVRIANLGGTTLGLASGNTIWLDGNAAGWGWFVDPTPWDDSEFTTPGNQGEQGRMDLLTVLAHEIGHLLGHEHEDDGVMGDNLTAGTRVMPCSANFIDLSAVAEELQNQVTRRR